MALLNGGLKMNSGGRTIRIVVGIAILCLFLLADTSGASPPPAILEINGNEQASGIGDNCWKVENETFSACADYAGIITPAEPLLTSSPFTALLRLPLQELPEELYLRTFRVTDDDELKEYGQGVRVWRPKGNAINIYKRPLEPEPEFNLSLASGLYVFSVGAEWKDKGSVTYGFLVHVNDRDPGKASASPPPAILSIDGNEQASGIGNNCWKTDNEKPMPCGDTFTINTPADPLLTSSPFTAHLSLPRQESPEELGFSAIRVTDDDALNEAANDFRAWRWGLQGMEIQVPLESESDINLSLPPGLYVFNVFAKWEGKGDVSYGFLVQVYEPEGKKNVGFEFVLAITALLLVITIRLKRR